MSTPNVDYWKERFLQLESSSHRDAAEIADTIDAAYREATRDLDGEISRWFSRFADNNGLVSMGDARKLLNSDELKEFKWTVQDYIKAGKENGVSADWSKQLENASARWHISRLEAIKMDMRQTIEVLYGKQVQETGNLLEKTYEQTYGKTAYEIQKGSGVGFHVNGLNSRAIQTTINKPWGTDQRNFSERIWNNKEALINELHQQMSRYLISGGNINDVVSAIEKKMGTSNYNARRLVYTENAYIRSQGQLEGYRATKVEKAQFVAVLDERTSQICQDMDGTIIDVKDLSPGTTMPPLHPLCRSTTIPYYADMDGIGTRAARDPETGQTVQIDRDITYHEWAEQFMSEPEPEEEALNNPESSDRMNLDDCKTTEEVQNWMNEQDWFRPDSSGTGQFAINLSGVDLESAKGIAEAYQQVMTEFPCLIKNIDAVQAKALDPGTYAQCFTRGGGRVEVSTRMFKNAQAVINQYAKDLAAGFHPAGTDWKSIITHELGHALDGYLTNQGVGGSKGWDYKDVSALLRPKVMKACGLKVADARTEVSVYATKNAREWFAECFAESVRSETPRKVATEFRKQLNKLMSENGVIMK